MSQKASQKTVIDGIEYECYMLDPERANRILVTLSKALGPAAGALLDSSGGFSGLLDSEIKELGFAGAIEKLVRSLDHETIWGIVQTLASVSVVVGKGKLDSLVSVQFTGRLAHMYRWLGWSLKVQFADFIDAFATAQAAFAGAEKTAE